MRTKLAKSFVWLWWWWCKQGTLVGLSLPRAAQLLDWDSHHRFELAVPDTSIPVRVDPPECRCSHLPKQRKESRGVEIAVLVQVPGRCSFCQNCRVFMEPQATLLNMEHAHSLTSAATHGPLQP
jgi:hypothetical protein